MKRIEKQLRKMTLSPRSKPWDKTTKELFWAARARDQYIISEHVRAYRKPRTPLFDTSYIMFHLWLRAHRFIDRTMHHIREYLTNRE